MAYSHCNHPQAMRAGVSVFDILRQCCVRYKYYINNGKVTEMYYREGCNIVFNHLWKKTYSSLIAYLTLTGTIEIFQNDEIREISAHWHNVKHKESFLFFFGNAIKKLTSPFIKQYNTDTKIPCNTKKNSRMKTMRSCFKFFFYIVVFLSQ